MFKRIYEFFKRIGKEEKIEELPSEQNAFYQITFALKTMKEYLKEMDNYTKILKESAKSNQNTYNQSKLIVLKNNELTDSLEGISLDLNQNLSKINSANKYLMDSKEKLLNTAENFENTNFNLVELESNIKKII